MSTAAEVLRQTFGFEQFRPGQREVIEHLLAGRSAAAVFPTGSGKSLCYQLTALLLPGVTVVVSPLIALMKEQIDRLQVRSIRAERLDSTRDAGEVAAITAALRAGQLRLLYVAPERFNNERFRSARRARPRFAVRRGRGALHLRMGAQFSSRLPQARPLRRRLPRRTNPGPDGHRHAASPRRYLSRFPH